MNIKYKYYSMYYYVVYYICPDYVYCVFDVLKSILTHSCSVTTLSWSGSWWKLKPTLALCPVMDLMGHHHYLPYLDNPKTHSAKAVHFDLGYG